MNIVTLDEYLDPLEKATLNERINLPMIDRLLIEGTIDQGTYDKLTQEKQPNFKRTKR